VAHPIAARVTRSSRTRADARGRTHGRRGRAGRRQALCRDMACCDGHWPTGFGGAPGAHGGMECNTPMFSPYVGAPHTWAESRAAFAYMEACQAALPPATHLHGYFPASPGGAWAKHCGGGASPTMLSPSRSGAVALQRHLHGYFPASPGGAWDMHCGGGALPTMLSPSRSGVVALQRAPHAQKQQQPYKRRGGGGAAAAVGRSVAEARSVKGKQAAAAPTVDTPLAPAAPVKEPPAHGADAAAPQAQRPPQVVAPAREDDYDPRKAQYVSQASKEEVGASEASLARQQIARLEASVARRRAAGAAPQAWLDHYEGVLDDMKSRAAMGGRRTPPMRRWTDGAADLDALAPGPGAGEAAAAAAAEAAKGRGRGRASSEPLDGTASLPLGTSLGSSCQRR